MLPGLALCPVGGFIQFETPLSPNWPRDGASLLIRRGCQPLVCGCQDRLHMSMYILLEWPAYEDNADMRSREGSPATLP